VDCCEEVYAEYVMTDKYVKVHGDMVNSLMAVKQQGRKMMDDTMGSLNMPTRREIDTIHQRVQQLRRDENAQNRQIEVMESDLRVLIEAQAAKIISLEEKITKLEAKPAPRRTAARKTSVKKTEGAK